MASRGRAAPLRPGAEHRAPHTAGRAGRLICETLADEPFQSTPARRQAVAELSVRAQVKAALVADRAIRSVQVFVDCRGRTHVVNEIAVLSASRARAAGV